MRFCFSLLLFPALLLALAASPLQARPWAPQPHLTVEGEARLTLEADRVDIQARFTREHENSRLALQELEARFGSLVRSLQSQVPAEARLEAGQVRITPKYTRHKDDWRLSGYTATRDLNILDLPVEATGEWLEKLAQGEPSQLGPLHYHSTQADNQRHPALEQALLEARNKARLMARTLGQNIGIALQIEEVSLPGISPRAVMLSTAQQEDQTPEIEPGLVEVKARVSVVFELLE